MNEINPFTWGFVEEKALKTLAQRTNAVYSEPQEVIRQQNIAATPYEEFASQEFGVAPNPAFVVSHDKLDPIPYLIS